MKTRVAPKKVRVHVTAKDIREGVPGNSGFCPIARALRRRLPPQSKVTVGNFNVYINGRKYRMPRASSLFVELFDDHARHVSPTSFVFSLDL